MQLGRFTIEQLSEGQFELFPDGKINRTPVDESISGYGASSSGNNLAGINPVYVTDGTHHILLDTGLGWGLDSGSSYTDVSNIETNLDVFGIVPDDITHVILSHLHYDHTAGSSYTDSTATTRPAFPNATYLAQHAEWNYALQEVNRGEVSSEFYNLDDIYRLYANDYFALIQSQNKEIIPGITLIRTGGHTPGHQIVKIQDQGVTAYFLGDLIPTETELNFFDQPTKDADPLEMKKAKVNLLSTAYQEKAFLLFYHSIHSKIGQLDKDRDRNFVLREI